MCIYEYEKCVAMSPDIKFPYEIKPLDEEINTEMLKYFNGERTGFVQVGPEKYFFPYKYKSEAQKYYNFQARPSDIWIVTFPRSGTTLTQELVWLLASNLDFDTASQQALTERFPFFEFSLFLHEDVRAELCEENKSHPKKLEFIKKLSVPGYISLSAIPTDKRRFIKTHFPFSLLPPSVKQQNCQIIYVSRNPKSVAVSYYHLNRLFRTQGYTGDFQRYWEYFENALNPWMPYYSHLKEAVAMRAHTNVLFLEYEDMIVDMRKAITEIASFLKCSVSDGGMEQLMHHIDIRNFRKNPAVNGHELYEAGILNEGEAGFVRTGCNGVNDVQVEFAENPQLMKRINEWIERNEKIFLMKND